jgi:uncharacterized membrane protein
MVDERTSLHVEETVQQLVELDQRHHNRAPLIQLWANRLASTLGRPASVATILLLTVAWMIGNYLVTAWGAHGVEQFPFPDLGFVATIVALFVALLILTAQRHDQALADKRAQLTLQIAMLSERKIAKLIALIQEQRRDNPLLADRLDPEVDEMAQPADPIASLNRIEASGPTHLRG